MRRALGVVLLVLALLAVPSAAGAIGEQQLSKILTRQMDHAGPFSGVYVEDVGSGVPVYSKNATEPLVPASVEKLWSTAAVLSYYRDDERLLTSVLKDRPIAIDGTLHGNLYLRGSGDPELTTHDLKDLAGQVSRSGIARVKGRVVGDGTQFDRKRGVASANFQPSPEVPPL